MSALLELQRKVVEKERKYFENLPAYLKTLAKLIEETLGSEARILLFGSVVRGNFIPGKSDIDILVVSPNVPRQIHERSKIVARYLKTIGDNFAPFEIHFATPEEFKGWYQKFIKNEFKEWPFDE